jgi:poly-gamma-glutamate synthesis protein (capsule biosynthesis protein)
VGDDAAVRTLIAAALSGILLAACGGGSVVVVVVGPPTATVPVEVEDATVAETATVALSPTVTATPASLGRVTLAAVGDVMLDRSIGRRILAGEATTLLADVAPVLATADIAVANLETALSDLGAPQAKGYTFRSPPEAVDTLLGAGIDVVGLANNHALDYGPEALVDTAARLAAAGIASAGAGANESAAREPALIERNGIRVAFLSYVDTAAEGSYSRGTWDAAPDLPGVAWADTAEIDADVRAAGDVADIVVVLLHCGIEYSQTPTDLQRTYARAAIDAGALLVLGTHAHVLQPVEEYGGGLIAYSLGNFVFDGFDGVANDTAILLVTIEGAAITSWELVPARVVDGIPRLVD